VKKEMRKELPTRHESNGVAYVPPKPNWGQKKAKSKK
jgi:hypothetical protein